MAPADPRNSELSNKQVEMNKQMFFPIQYKCKYLCTDVSGRTKKILERKTRVQMAEIKYQCFVTLHPWRLLW